jgi:hypothetical protein
MLIPATSTPKLLWKFDTEAKKAKLLSGVVDVNIINSEQTFATDRPFNAEQMVIKTSKPIVILLPIDKEVSSTAHCIGKNIEDD